ncbi:MAG: hypothetical protein IKT91_03445 [Clostridia bacterium]|nr:hypothetical protein [Clostridia bacterium]
MKSKTVSSLVLRRIRLITIAVVVSLLLFSLLASLFYRILRQSYHNDALTPLYTVSGKCTELEYKRKIGRSGLAYYLLTIDGEQYRLNKRILSADSEEEYALFEKALTEAEQVTLRYVVSIGGNAMVADLELPGSKQYIHFDEVVKENHTGSNIAFVVSFLLYLGGQSVIVVTTYFRLKQLPSLKKARRKALRKKERAARERSML